MGMLDFYNMLGNYDERKVGRYPDDDNWVVDTCEVTDSQQPYETAVKHPLYNDGAIVVVQLYDTKEEAQAGHEEWVKRMTCGDLPLSLTDVSTATISKLCDVVGGTDWRKRAAKETN